MDLTRKHNPELTANAKKLRREMTKEEKHLWYDYLRHYPVRFLRQKVIDLYIADFYCHEARIVIELDGSQHYTAHGLSQDEVRTKLMENRGLLVLRIPNKDVDTHFKEVCAYIDSMVKQRLQE